MSPNQVTKESWICKLPCCGFLLLSCAIVQGAFLSEDVPQEYRREIEELYRTMQNLIIKQLPHAFRSIDVPTINAVGRAMQSVYMDLTKSRSSFEDEAEACKP